MTDDSSKQVGILAASNGLVVSSSISSSNWMARSFAETPVLARPERDTMLFTGGGAATLIIKAADIQLLYSRPEAGQIYRSGDESNPVSEYEWPIQQDVGQRSQPQALSSTSVHETVTLSGYLRITGLLIIVLAITGVLGNFISHTIVIHPLFAVVIFLSGVCFFIMAFAKPS